MLRKINFIFNRSQKIRLIILFFMIIIAGLLETLGVSAVMPLVSIMLDPGQFETNNAYKMIADIVHISSVNGFIMLMAIILIIVYIVKNVYLMIQFRIQYDFNNHCKRDISAKLMKCYINQEYLYHVQHNVAELNRNVTNDVTQFFSMVQAVMNLLSEIITCIFILAYLLWVDSSTTLFLVVVLSVFLIAIFLIFKKYQEKAGEEARKSTGKMGKWVLQIFGGIKEIKVLNREKYFYNKYVNAFNTNIAAVRLSNILTRFPRYIIETVCVGSLLIVICIRVYLGVNLVAFATVLTGFGVAAVRLLPSFNRVTEYLGTIMFSKASTDNIFNDLQEEVELSRNKTFQNEDIRVTLSDKIVVENIWFKYPNTDKYIFENASVEIRKNESVAFIGSSGAGKSTIADIILGLIKPESGKILADGMDIYENLTRWHEIVGYIPQTIYLMDDSIRNNIIFGGDNKDDDRLWESLKVAQLEEFVMGLPDGLDTEIGDRGVRLSGGQRQRIGIARALYNKPELLILDEATSALDNETEAAVMEAVENLHGHTTMIIIAHRLSTIEHCDKVYEVKDGIILKKDGD